MNSTLKSLASCVAVFAAVGLLAVGFQGRVGTSVERFGVVVVGAGPGGVAAAIQAASQGQKVALVESTGWIGGQMTAAGDGTMDEGNTRARVSGVYADFVRRARAFYRTHGKSISTCYHSRNAICVDPAVGQQILKDMLAARSGISVFLHATVVRVEKTGSAVRAVGLSSGEQLDTTMVIDATDQGDVVAKAGAAYRVGTGTVGTDAPHPPAANACVRDLTYTAVIRKYPHGVPSDLRFTKAPPGYSDAIRRAFGAFVQQNGFDLATKQQLPLNFAGHSAYRGLPDLTNPHNYNAVDNAGADITRTDVNLANDYPATVGYIEDPAIRTKTTCEAKLRTLQFIYYLQHDLGQHQWSIANDEGWDKSYSSEDHCPLFKGFESFEKYFPVAPYTRESRRIVGVETLTGGDIRRDRARGGAVARVFSDSVAVGYFPIDLGHHCATEADLEPGLDSTADYAGHGSQRPFEVPLGALIPVRVNGLLAAEKNISVSRIAETAIREQPIAFAVGQAAGALAAEAVRERVPARNVPATRVRNLLRTSHAIVDVPYR